MGSPASVSPAFTSIASAASLLEPGQHLGTRPTLSASPLYMRGAAQGMFLAEPNVLVTTLDSQKRIFWNQINDLTPTTYYVLLPTLSNLDHCKVGTPALLCQILLMTLGVLCAVSFFASLLLSASAFTTGIRNGARNGSSSIRGRNILVSSCIISDQCYGSSRMHSKIFQEFPRYSK